jgi:hypothetical protein
MTLKKDVGKYNHLAEIVGFRRWRGFCVVSFCLREDEVIAIFWIWFAWKLVKCMKTG